MSSYADKQLTNDDVRKEHAHLVRSERPKAYLLSDFVGPLLVAVLWLLLPFEASTAGRWTGAVALVLMGPAEQLMRWLLPIKWTNFGPLVLRSIVAITLMAAVPAVWHPCAIFLTAGAIGTLSVEPLPRFSALSALGMGGMAVTGLARDIEYWYASVAIAVILVVFHGVWYRAWSAERSDVDVRHSEMVDGSLMFSWEIDATDGTLLSVVGNVEGVLGWTAHELVGRDSAHIIDVQSAQDVLRRETALSPGERYNLVEVAHKDGHPVTLREFRRVGPRTGTIRGVSVDITELAEATEALRHQAERDSLTGLANRSIVESVINEAVRDPAGTAVALLLADLDRFKEINDTLGHPTGDRVLCVLAERFSKELSDLAVVARLGGDEFAFVAYDDDAERTTDLAQRIHDLATAPVEIDGLELAVACSVGVSLSPAHGDTWADLLKHADIATYQAKRRGGGVQVFESIPDDLTVQRLRLISETPAGLDAGEFELHFQPQVDLATGQIIGVEGLARWRHPEHGLLGPGAFFHAIEVAADYHRFTTEMLRQGVEFAALANEAGHHVQVSVNVGTMSFLDQGLPAAIAEMLATHGVSPDALTLEVVETDLLEDQTGDGPVFAALEALGVRLSIDDFGTGYSSFTRLRSLNVDEVKIDQAFVRGLGNSEEDAIIVRATIQLAQLLDLEVVAEGVETSEQLAWLQRLGCATGQGFLWSPAVHRDEMLAMLKSTERFSVGTDPDIASLHDAFARGLIANTPLQSQTSEPT